MPWKMLIILTLAIAAIAAVSATGFAQTQTQASRVAEVVAINGQLANGAYVMTASGTIQAWVCPSPQPYVTRNGRQGWACFDPSTSVWLLGAVPPPSAPPVVATARPPADTPYSQSFAADDVVQAPQAGTQPQVIYIEAPPRVVYIEAPPRVIYVEPPPPDVVYVQTPPVIIVERGGRGRGGRDRDRDDRVDPPVTGFAVAPAYTNTPAFVNRPAFANPGAPVATDNRDRRDGARDGQRGGAADGNANTAAQGQRGGTAADTPARGR